MQICVLLFNLSHDFFNFTLALLFHFGRAQFLILFQLPHCYMKIVSGENSASSYFGSIQHEHTTNQCQNYEDPHVGLTHFSVCFNINLLVA